jgi:hypothetical protein
MKPALFSRTSESSVLTITAQAEKRNPHLYAQKYKKVLNIYRATGSEVVQLNFVG